VNLSEFSSGMLPSIDGEIRKVLAAPILDPYDNLRDIMEYHLGYKNEKAIDGAQGKRIRPLLVLLTTAAVGGRWQNSLPAAAAVELLHNFSLIHDDIEDKSELRRGRPTIWTTWGVSLAINAGDAMYALAFHALDDLSQSVGTEAALRVYRQLTQTCILLTGGQHLDISYEKAQDIPLESYWAMIGGKTAALITTCVVLGAICAGAPTEITRNLNKFSNALGLSFQIKDDCLGIWGEDGVTGKSNSGDLASGKKSLPVLYGLQHGGAFASEWLKSHNPDRDYGHLAKLLENSGAREFAESQISRLTGEALHALQEANLKNDAGDALRELAIALINRKN